MITIYVAIDTDSYYHPIIAMSASKENLERFVREQIAKGEFDEGQIEIQVTRITDGIIVCDWWGDGVDGIGDSVWSVGQL